MQQRRLAVVRIDLHNSRHGYSVFWDGVLTKSFPNARSSRIIYMQELAKCAREAQPGEQCVYALGDSLLVKFLNGTSVCSAPGVQLRVRGIRARFQRYGVICTFRYTPASDLLATRD